jgi:hypothetical protein
MILDLRGLSGKDFRYLADEEVVRDDSVEDFILDHCSGAIIDPGPYTFAGSKVDWSKALVGDSTYAFLDIRRICYPKKPFVFPVKCGDRTCKGFKKGFEWEVDVAEYLREKSKSLSSEDRDLVKAGNRFEGTIPGTDHAFTFRLKTRADARRLKDLVKQIRQSGKKKQKEFNLAISSMAFSILEIESVPKEAGINGRVAYLEDLPIGDIDELMVLIESHDCGVDTSIEVTCPECEGDRTIELPFDRTFFLPESGRRKQAPAEIESDESPET